MQGTSSSEVGAFVTWKNLRHTPRIQQEDLQLRLSSPKELFGRSRPLFDTLMRPLYGRPLFLAIPYYIGGSQINRSTSNWGIQVLRLHLGKKISFLGRTRYSNSNT
jgi:hypothetical protein